METTSQILNKLSDYILTCSASKSEKEILLKVLADLIVSLIKRDANE